MNAFLSGEEWKLQAFRDYDNGTGPDLYKLAYSKSFGVPVEQIGKGHERQIGKVQELALGYQGGVGAFITMGDTYNVKPEDLVKPVRNATPNEAWDKVAETYASATNKFELPEDQWTAISLIVAGWRKGHPNTTQSWWDLQDAGLAAVETPHTIHEIYHGRARYMSDGNYLYCQLPSGRVICYAQPHIRTTRTEHVEIEGVWHDVDTFFPWELDNLKVQGCKFRVRVRNQVWFYGVDGETKQWREDYMYGGFQAENIIQAASRCVLDRAMFRVENGGYPIILHAHDEILSEVVKGVGSETDFERLMEVDPKDEPWLAGFPLAVSTWTDTRYVK
jgi:DNA polymerase